VYRLKAGCGVIIGGRKRLVALSKDWSITVEVQIGRHHYSATVSGNIPPGIGRRPGFDALRSPELQRRGLQHKKVLEGYI
jgi:hypothetical protein